MAARTLATPIWATVLVALSLTVSSATRAQDDVGRAHRGQSPPNSATSAQPDLVLITLDTLRADAVGFAGNADASTPHLDRLAEGGRVFTDAHAHNVVTLPSHANMLTGLYPYQHGIRDNEGYRLDDALPTLATLLRGAGYATGAFVSAYPLDSTFGLDQGFDVYDDQFPRGGRDHEFSLAERSGDQTVERALAWWQATEGPRFLWLHLYDPHAPYEAPEPFASRFPDAPYLAEVAATDHYLAPLLAACNRPAPPLLVVTSDHGEALGDHGELTHGLFAYEATLAVPLLMWGHNVVPGRDDRAARHIDIFPTLLQAAGVDVPEAPSGLGLADPTRHGRSLLAPLDPNAPEGIETTTYFEALSASLNRGWAPLYGVLKAQQKLIVLPLPELYALAEDPAESHNLVREQRRRAGELRQALPPREWIWPPGGERQTSEASSAALESLGYLSGQASTHTDYGPDDDPKQLIQLDRSLHHAIDLYSQGDLEGALKLTSSIVEERPGMGLGQSLHAQTLLQAGRRDEALEAMRAAYARGAANRPLMRQLGLTLAEMGHHEESLAVLRPLANDGDLATSNALALATTEAGQHDAALEILQAVLRRDPDNGQAYEVRSLIALRRQRWTEARDVARKAIVLDASLARAHNNLGVALAQLEDLDAAVDAWQRAVDLDASLFDAWYNLGTQALAAGRDAQALDALRHFVDHAPESNNTADLRRARVLLRRLERRLETP